MVSLQRSICRVAARSDLCLGRRDESNFPPSKDEGVEKETQILGLRLEMESHPGDEIAEVPIDES